MLGLGHSCIVFSDETPLQYAPKIKGTYCIGGQSHQVHVHGAAEKRQCTATPVTASTGQACTWFFLFPYHLDISSLQVLLVQTLWKGRTSQSHPRCVPPPSVYFDHSERKMQTSETWDRLLSNIEVKLVQWRALHGLSPGYPCLLICDNVGSHNKAGLRRPEGAMQACEHLYQSIKHPTIFLFYILKNRSHTLQSGDMHVNLSLRRHCRNQAKMRAVGHFLRIHLGELPGAFPLTTSEMAMKPLAVQWLAEWLHDPRLQNWVQKSWAMAMHPCAGADDQVDLPEEGTMAFDLSSQSSQSSNGLSQSSGVHCIYNVSSSTSPCHAGHNEGAHAPDGTSDEADGSAEEEGVADSSDSEEEEEEPFDAARQLQADAALAHAMALGLRARR